MTSTPAKASRVGAPDRPGDALRRAGAARARPTISGLVNWIAVASASGIAITPRKKQMVATPPRRRGRIAARAAAHEALAPLGQGDDDGEADRARSLAQRRHRRPRPLPGHRLHHRIAERQGGEAAQGEDRERCGRCVGDTRMPSRAVRQLSKFPPYSPPQREHVSSFAARIAGTMSAFGRRSGAEARAADARNSASRSR